MNTRSDWMRAVCRHRAFRLRQHAQPRNKRWAIRIILANRFFRMNCVVKLKFVKKKRSNGVTRFSQALVNAFYWLNICKSGRSEWQYDGSNNLF